MSEIFGIIMVVLAVIVLVWRLFGGVIIRKLMEAEDKKGVSCENCKEKMENTSSRLYLLPVFFDHSHEESAEYYVGNATPITDRELIPSGQRACWMHIFTCAKCGRKKVSIVEFLRVRDQDLIKGGDIYPYEKFQYFFEQQMR